MTNASSLDMSKHNKENNARTNSSKENESEIETTPEKYAENVPDGGYGWVIVFCTFCINVLVDGIGLSFGVLLPEFVDYFKEKKSKVALVGMVMVGIVLASGPVIGVFIDSFGSRPPIIVGSVLAAMALVSASFSSNLNVLIVTYGAFGGIGLGLMHLPVFVSASEYFDKKRPIAAGIAICGTGIGTIAYPPFIEYLVHSYDWKMTLWVLAGMTLVGGIVFGALVRPFKGNIDHTKAPIAFPANDTISEEGQYVEIISETNYNSLIATSIDIEMNKRNDHLRKLSKVHPTNEIFTISGVHDTIDTKKKQPKIVTLAKEYFGLFKNHAFLILLIGNVFGMIAYMIPFIYIVDRALLLEITNKDAALLLSIIGVVNTISRIGSGVIVSLFNIEAITLSIIALVVGSFSGFLQQFCDDYSLLVLYCISFGFSCAFVANAPDIVCKMVGVAKLANGMGFVLFAWGIGAVSGPYIAGLVFEATDNYNASFYLCGGSYLVTAITQIIAKIILKKSNKVKCDEISLEVSPVVGNEKKR